MAKWTALSKEQKLEMDVKTIHEAYQFLVKKVVDEKAKLSVGTKFKKVQVSQKKSTGKKIVQKRQSRPKVVSRAAPKRNLTTSKKLSQTRSKESGAEAKNVHKEAEKKPDCCCSENIEGEVLQSCWMCRLSQRLGGKLIGNKTKLK